MSRPSLDRWRPATVVMGGVQGEDCEHIRGPLMA